MIAKHTLNSTYVYRLRTDGSYIYVGRTVHNYRFLPFKKSHYAKIALFDRSVGPTFDAYVYPPFMKKD